MESPTKIISVISPARIHRPSAQIPNSAQDEEVGRDIALLKSRAQQLLVPITCHKNHVDRHDINISKEDMKTIF